MKTLQIGENYGDVFGFDKDLGQTMIYNGGISWTATNGDKSKTIDSQGTSDKVLEYINRTSINQGVIK